ncbi:hypothetical protein SLS55_005473 [Diplodia seriata]|uniref:DUF1989 domain-containing protein n=1 Tax=Diplodia seriata TaxID=420778 RepID=A0ABR3CGH1_9PEZI
MVVNRMLTGRTYDYHCHSNLVRAVLPHGLAETDVHDVLNVFQVTGLDDKGRYFMEASPSRPDDYLEFFAEQDLLCALSTCPGGDLSEWGWVGVRDGETEEGEGARKMKETCRPIRVEVFEIAPHVREEVLRGQIRARGVLGGSSRETGEEDARTAERFAVLSFFCYGQREQYRMRPTDILRSLTVQPVDCKELFDYLPERYYQDPVTFLGDPLSRLWEQFSRMALDDRHQQIRSWKRRAYSLEMFDHLNLKEGGFAIISTAVIFRDESGSSKFWKRLGCEQRIKACLETTKLLFKRLDSGFVGRKKTEDLLISAVGGNAASSCSRWSSTACSSRPKIAGPSYDS